MNNETYLVTGAMGCIGAWVLYHLVKDGKQAVSFDLSEDRHRLNLLLTPEEQQKITFVQGDLTDTAQLLETFETHGITHVIHLAALQVPFCKADPVLGARVNVVGTVNIFEGARQTNINHLAYASSIAVYGPADLYPTGPLAHDARPAPRTLYGVYKNANEGTAQVYWHDHQISSIALRPYTVYGVGRDQGLTSEPTKAMLAAASGQSFDISFGGVMQLQLASDVAHNFVEAARHPFEGAEVFNYGTNPVAISTIVEMIQAAVPEVEITYQDVPLPFPEAFDGSALAAQLPNLSKTSLREGIQDTIARFKECLARGVL
ncbi:MAG: NAD-dependent epimerase/dehydratase family protein [Chloroflexota bacterium]